jgi:predicted nucleic acid-binding Zn finger protein
MSAVADRATFRETLAQAAVQAKLLLPAQVNGRLEKAVALVLHGDVEPQADGTMTVYSATDATRRYILQGSSCTCSDYERRQAPEGWCAHKIAANLQRSVERVLARSTPVESEAEVILPEPMEAFPDNDHEEVEMPSPTPAAVPCPEALFSLTLKGHIDGHEALLTARGQTAAEFRANLAAIRGLLDAKPQVPAPQLSPQQFNALAMHRPVAGVCPIHQVPMRENEKNGQRWFSHRLPEGGFCKGR